MASKTIKRNKKETSCKCESNIQTLLSLCEDIKKRQNILMDGHTHLSNNIKSLSLWSLIVNSFRKK